MASFILRNLDPDFWARVQAKATREGTTVKAVILQLLTTWVGVVVLALLTAACSDVKGPSMTAPSPVVAAAPVASTITLTSVSGIGGSAGTVYLTAVVKDVTGKGVSAAIVHLSTTSGRLQAADVTADAGGQAQALVTTAAAATITATSGSASSTIDVMPTALPAPIALVPPVLAPTPPPPPPSVPPILNPPVLPPPPPPPPVAPPASLALSMGCTAAAHGSSTTCNLSATYGGQPVNSSGFTEIDVDFGDGHLDQFHNTPLIYHTYAQAGTYLLVATATVTTTEGVRTGTASKSLVIP